MDIDDYKIFNVYKPPPTRLRSLDLQVLLNPCLYASNFDRWHIDWDYDNNSSEDECSAGWASVNSLALLYNAKEATSFSSGGWNTGTNPDLAFASVGPNSCLPDRRALEKFPRSQHRPSLITTQNLTLSMPSMPVKQWNFCKANWSHYSALKNQFAKNLLPPDLFDVNVAYQDFVTSSRKHPKRLSHAVIEIIIVRVGMRSVNLSTQRSCSLLRETTRVWLLQR